MGESGSQYWHPPCRQVLAQRDLQCVATHCTIGDYGDSLGYSGAGIRRSDRIPLRAIRLRLVRAQCGLQVRKETLRRTLTGPTAQRVTL